MEEKVATKSIATTRFWEMKGNPRKKLRIPAGSQVDKPKHSKAHKT
jgi:hypothetical protein